MPGLKPSTEVRALEEIRRVGRVEEEACVMELKLEMKKKSTTRIYLLMVLDCF